MLIAAFSAVALTRAFSAAERLEHLRAGHPRLLIHESTVPQAIEAARTDPVRAALHARIVELARMHWSEEPIVHRLVGPRLLGESRKAIAHVVTNAMAFKLTGDLRHARFAIDQMLRAAAFPDWNPSHFLDVAEMATALALGYDWLHHELNAGERATIERALLDKALSFARAAYAREDPTRVRFPFVGRTLTNNWNQVCNGGFVLAALALADQQPDLLQFVVAGARDTLPHAMAAYEPDGGYPEGPVYWTYGTHFNALVLAALQGALDSEFGLADRPAFARTALFRLHVEGPSGLSFNFADGRPEVFADPVLTWLGQRFAHPDVVAHSRALLARELERTPDPGDRFFALHAVWFPTSVKAPHRLPLAAHFRGPSDVAVLRSAWGDPRALWLGLKAGGNRVNHGHLDLGSFVLDADGVRWAVDLGPDDYDLPNYWDGTTRTSGRWQYFRMNNRSHNTLTPGDTLQDPDAVATIERCDADATTSFAIVDFSQAYPGTAQRFRRGASLLNRSRILVQDEVAALRPGTPLVWRMLTPAQVEVAARSATLTWTGRTLRVDLLAPDHAHFATHAATPPTATENQNKGISVLEATVPASPTTADVRLVVLLSPVTDQTPQNSPPAIRSLDDW